MRALRALIKSRPGTIGESWRTVGLTGLQNGLYRGPEPYPIYAFGAWFAAVDYVIGSTHYCRILSSADGLVWSFVADVFTAATEIQTLCAAYNDATIMFGGRYSTGQITKNGWMVVSQDGALWNSTLAAPDQVQSVAYENNVFLAEAANVGLRRSTDFVNWSTIAGTFASPTGAANLFVAIQSGYLASSSNGQTWTAISAMAGKSISHLSFAGGRFWASTLDATRQLWWSADGANWYQASVPSVFQSNAQAVWDMGFAAGLWYLFFRKSDFSTWGAIMSSTGNSFADVSASYPAPTFGVSSTGPFLWARKGYAPQTAVISP